MDFTAEHDEFRAVVRSFVEQEVNPRIPEWEEAEMMPLRDIFSKMGSLGFLGLEYEPEFGGQGGAVYPTQLTTRSLLTLPGG